MRVLQPGKFYPSFRGGIETTVHELTEGLARAGVPVEAPCSGIGRGTRCDEIPGYRMTRASNGHTGYNVPVGSPSAQPVAAQSLDHAARKHFLAECTAEIMMKRTLALYEQGLRRRLRNPRQGEAA